MNTSLSTLPESEKLTELLNFATGYQKAKVLFAFTELDIADVSENKKNLRRIYDKLTNGGACLLSGLIMDNSRFAPQTAVLFCLEDICRNAPDVERSEKTYTEWLHETGFENISCETYLAPTKLLRGFKV